MAEPEPTTTTTTTNVETRQRMVDGKPVIEVVRAVTTRTVVETDDARNVTEESSLDVLTTLTADEAATLAMSLPAMAEEQTREAQDAYRAETEAAARVQAEERARTAEAEARGRMTPEEALEAAAAERSALGNALADDMAEQSRQAERDEYARREAEGEALSDDTPEPTPGLPGETVSEPVETPDDPDPDVR